MKSRWLDRHVRKEAKLLVRDAKRLRKGKEHTAEIGAVEDALAKKDREALRQGMPALDQIVEKLAKQGKPLQYHAVDGFMWIASLAALVFVLRTFVVQVFQIPSSSMYPTLMIGDHLFVNKFIYGFDIPFSDGKIFTRSPSRGEIIVFAQPCTPERDYIKRVVAVAGDTVEVRCNKLHVNGKAVKEEHVEDPNCEYEDRDEAGVWHMVPCSRYRETAGGFTYETFHDPERPGRDALSVGDDLDFPSLRERSDKNCSTGPSFAPAANQSPGKIVDVKSGDACELQVHYVVPTNHVFVMGDNRAHSNDSRFWGSVPLENIRGKAMFIWLSYREFSPTQLRFQRMGDFVH